jgi:serine/threonine protein kinase
MLDTAARAGIADYEFVRPLGRLGRGDYYLARRPARVPVDDEFVTVKILAGSPGEDAFTRATRELRAFAAVQSPELVRLYDAGQEGDNVFYAMEYHPLGSLAAPARRLERGEVVRAVADAARAAHALHEHGIVHCDIQPASIVLHDGGGRLADLGLAQVLRPGEAIAGMSDVAAVEFVDPALLIGGQYGRATDIWSLGATLHRVLTGAGIYGDLDQLDALLALRTVLTSEPILAGGLSSDEEDLVRWSLAPDPIQRPETAAAFAEVLERWID